MGGNNSIWDEIEPLPPSLDHNNICRELSNAIRVNDKGSSGNYSSTSTVWVTAESQEISTKLEQLGGVELYSLAKCHLIPQRKNCISAFMMILLLLCH